MPLYPVAEQDANDEILEEYRKLKEAFNVSKIPLFFTYLGNFPRYLSYITNQIINNLNDQKFGALLDESSKKTQDLLSQNLGKSDELIDFISRYKNAPYFYNFQTGLRSIFKTNMKLVFVFMSIREALKGWAIAAHKIAPSVKSDTEEKNITIRHEDFIFEPEVELKEMEINKYSEEESATGAVVIHQKHSIEVDLLPKYLWLCKREFLDVLKTDEFWILRVGIEKSFLSYLEFIPSLIFSPVNLVLDLTENNPDYPDLLYLLSEQFPTLATQRMIFSGYMMV